MTTETPYLLDQLELADMLEIDGLHAANFTLNDDLLDQADAAAEADESFESEEIVLTIEALDGRERKRWQFSYNSVMEAEHDAAANSWLIEGHRLVCFEAIGADSEDE
ncbi:MULTISPECIES: DUF5629 family protein [Pseudomonas]|uniref:DUF5629 family protein n=1 Tax=Pseudomonas luteola TaxID=47886 RepID=A0A2X2CHD0_PSELU|nr:MULTISPECIES: DUF5629 family protein [Pseudomonas]ENA37262.1 hypothetical protein HMPREF1487_04585 [Pseudomonas sp. HPB0071]MBF8643528.1 DUF5629 family protein [Pseudomonas zeshuii]RRW41982.1 hypothetical protein EGJ50_21905 [Pseudomonas luteola]SHJ73850.1 hypothetical protein SAMN05216295_12619 [Pseudomonas zeshuii]SPZ08122.1 lipoprotein [Pseudomonas luteola]